MEQPATGTRHNPTYICIYTAVDSVITLRKNGFSYISKKINTSQIGIGRNVIHSLRPLFVIDKDSLCIAACHHVTDAMKTLGFIHERVFFALFVYTPTCAAPYTLRFCIICTDNLQNPFNFFRVLQCFWKQKMSLTTMTIIT